ncbi:unnamed protein product, partial [Tilletia caries]
TSAAAWNTIATPTMKIWDHVSESDAQYALVGATFLVNDHFTCMLHHPDGTTHHYDSLNNSGLTSLVTDEIPDLRAADMLIYAKF